MNKRFFFGLLFCFLLAGVLSAQNKKETLVLISTELGDIKIKLYNETPQHRDNFIKLAREGFYNGTLFHRVIRDFMIQGGDPDSKNAEPGVQLGNGGVGYTLPAEIHPDYFHKRGALAAARLGDQVNPKKESSGCQFYIVHGRRFTEADLKKQAEDINKSKKQLLLRQFFSDPENKAYAERMAALQQSKDQEGVQSLYREVEPIIDAQLEKERFSYTKAQTKAYTSAQGGGAPHLDGNYTVFGEVVEGMEVVDKIASLQVDKMTRPLSDINMEVKVIK